MGRSSTGRALRRLKPLDVEAVTIDGGFWGERQRINRQATIPIVYRRCRQTGRIDAFRLDWRPGRRRQPHIFWDSDVAKWVEAAALSLTTHPDRRLAGLVDRVVDLIVSAQQPDGYLNTHFTVVEPEKRWCNLRDQHELYCAGHLMEAAVAHFRATGSRRFLDAMARYADYIGSVLGRGRGKKRGYPGHEEIELALVKLSEATGANRFLRLAKYFVDERGRGPHYFDKEARARGDDPHDYRHRTHEVFQAHRPVREQSKVVGHAVRAFYLYSGMADVAALTGDTELLAACRRLWRDATERKMYITGGVGPSAHNEGFTRPYDLPNETAYAETCAAIALVFFAHRMLQIEADGKYADVMERALCNGVPSGVSLDGERFFYVNPLAVAAGATGAGARHQATSRQPWFGTACCPPNIARLIASLGQYVYSVGKAAVYVHLYVAGSGQAEIAGRKVLLTQQTNYPWDGCVHIRVGLDGPATFSLMLRVPGWCKSYTLLVNGKRVAGRSVKGYVRIRRRWQDGDRVELSLAMPVERMAAHPAVGADAGRAALQRGPVVYCLEQCDHDVDVHSIALPKQAKLHTRFDRELLGGTTVIEGEGSACAATGWKGRLYRPVGEGRARRVRIRAVPYCLWGNRKPGALAVWLPQA